MNFKDRFYIKNIPKKQSHIILLSKHYLHRVPAISYTFGLFDKESRDETVFGFSEDRMIGVITYGIPASPSLCEAICGKEFSQNVIELNRLWIEDGTPQNVESFLVSNSMKMVPYDIIISYADQGENHQGIIYQATNFLYTGMSAETKEWSIDGESKHSRHLTDDYSMEELKKMYGDRLQCIRASKKFRYVYFNCSKGKRKFYMKRLKWEILPYPKLRS